MTFRQRRNLFFKARLQIFWWCVSASGRCVRFPPICRCIINLHRKTLGHLGKTVVFRTLQHQCRSVRTVRTHQTFAEVSRVWSVMGPKCP